MGMLMLGCSGGPMREDKALREKMWKEIIGVLELQEPRIKELVRM